MMRALAFSTALSGAVAVLPAAALAQERPLNDQEVLALADRQAVWCENWSDETRDCETLYMLRREEDGSLISAGMFVLSQNPTIQVTIADRVTLQDGRLCSSGSTDELNIEATVGGRPSVEAGLMVRLLLSESMAAYQESEICQQLFTSGDPEWMGEIITADDLRLYDFESTYRIGTLDSGFLLRPMIDDTPDDGQIQL